MTAQYCLIGNYDETNERHKDIIRRVDNTNGSPPFHLSSCCSWENYLNFGNRMLCSRTHPRDHNSGSVPSDCPPFSFSFFFSSLFFLTALKRSGFQILSCTGSSPRPAGSLLKGPFLFLTIFPQMCSPLRPTRTFGSARSLSRPRANGSLAPSSVYM